LEKHLSDGVVAWLAPGQTKGDSLQVRREGHEGDEQEFLVEGRPLEEFFESAPVLRFGDLKRLSELKRSAGAKKFKTIGIEPFHEVASGRTRRSDLEVVGE
jgi:hypothetical protein